MVVKEENNKRWENYILFKARRNSTNMVAVPANVFCAMHFRLFVGC